MMNSLFSQHKKYKGATLIEVMMMLLIVSLSLTTMFYTFSQTIQFARDTESRIKATALAREGIEAIVNIRNTNWLLFPNNRTKCWNTLNYDKNCIASDNSTNIIKKGNYILTQNNKRWELRDVPATENLIENCPECVLGIDENGWYTSDDTKFKDIKCQNKEPANVNCTTPFYRIISIEPDEENKTMKITSTVYWQSQSIKKSSLHITLSTWKGHYDPK